jgi:hypothetical protein
VTQTRKPKLVCAALICASLLAELPGAQAQSQPYNPATTNAVTPQQMADYRKKLLEYLAIRRAFDDEAEAYWNSISEKRRIRIAKRRSGETIAVTDYVLTQPPVYSGPPMPVDPSGAPPPPAPPRQPIPVVADFLNNAMTQFQFAPRKPASENDYKRAYAKVASSFGLTRDQAVRVYGFESGGNGKYDVQAGLESGTGGRAISTALGYNQLLTTNTIDLLAEHGAILIKALKDKAAQSSGAQRQQLEQKLAILTRMIAFCKTVPNEWSAHEKLGVTPQGLGVHALNLDADIGPYLQTLKLMDSVNFARRKGYSGPLSAAELEMMNLTGDGNGFDMVSMPQAMRPQVPTSNFFQRRGYERNPVAIRNNTVSKLIAATDAKMDKEMALQGAKDLAAGF